MAINYVNISDLSALTQLNSSDKFLVSRNDIVTGYATYATTLAHLSAAISCDVASGSALSDFLITAVTDLGDKTKAVAGNIGSELYNNQQTILNNYLNKNYEGDSYISGRVHFMKLAPMTKTVSLTGENNLKKVVNIEMLSRYVSANCSPSIGTTKPVGYIYETITGGGATSDEIYEKQPSETVIKRSLPNRNKPLVVHKIKENCTVVISQRPNTANKGNIYTSVFKLDNDGAKAYGIDLSKKINLTLNESDWRALENWYYIGDVIGGSTSDPKTLGRQTVTFQASAGTFICICMVAYWQQPVNRFKIDPTRSTHTNTVQIRIDEYL